MVELGYDFITDLSAKMAGVTAEEYETRQQWMLNNLTRLNSIVEATNIKDEMSFDYARSIKTALCSLSCYTFNTNHPLNDTVWDMEAVLGKKMHKYVMKGLAPKDDNLRIRYLLWNKRYHGDELQRKAFIDHLLAKGYVFIRPSSQYHSFAFVVRGIYCKVGDNTFSVDRNGREHRQYKDVCMTQYFSFTWDQDIAYLKTLDVPMMEKSIETTGMYDGKNCARHPKITRADSHRLWGGTAPTYLK